MAVKKRSEPAKLGERIRKSRVEKGLTLTQLANETGVPEHDLEKIEAGETMPPVGSLLSLSRALDLDSDAFLKEEKAARKKLAKAYEKRTENYAYETLAPGARHKHMKAFRIRIEPKSAHQGVGYRHEGEEFVYVLSGSVEILVGEQKNDLGPGECLHFNSGVPHKLTNTGDSEAELIVVVYTP